MPGAATTEQVVWEGSPSQVTNLGTYVVCFLTCWLVIPVFYAIWRWIELRCYRYRLTNERLAIMQGVFSRRMEELELYRVKDITFEQPFFLRLFGLATLVLDTSDQSRPVVLIRAIPRAQELREQIRRDVERLRREKGIREFDVT